MSAESEDQFTAACAGQLFWEPGSCAHDGDHLGAVLKVHTGRMTTEQLRALLEQAELWKTDTTGFSIPEISFEEVEGTARVCSLWDFVSETADKLDAASNMFRGAAARNVLQAAAVLREIASGSASRPLTLSFRDPTGRVSLVVPPSAAASVQLAVERVAFTPGWEERRELGLARPFASQRTGADAVQEAARLLFTARAAILFTGAGVSTESGIPCYRGQKPQHLPQQYENTWDVYDPADELIGNFAARADCRERYWRRSLDLQPQFEAARPNASHELPKYLEETGRLAAVITTNVDRLYSEAGLGDARLLHLHGVGHLTQCLAKCQSSAPMPTRQLLDSIREQYADPLCEHCGAPLKPLTVSFGEPLKHSLEPGAPLHELVSAGDLLVVMGSSLTVAPSNSIPAIALDGGAPLCIINYDETHYDPYAHCLMHGMQCGVVCAAILGLLHQLDHITCAALVAGNLTPADLDLHFSRHSYCAPNTYTAGPEDRALFDQLRQSQTDLSNLCHLNRWYRHMAVR